MRYPILALISIGNRKWTKKTCIVSPLRDFAVKIERFQIKQNVLNLKWTLSLNNGYSYVRPIFANA